MASVRSLSLAMAVLLLTITAAKAQITVLGSFNPSNATTLCGIGYDPDSARVWVYGCSAAEFHSYDTSGTLISSVTVPGGTANDVDIDIAATSFLFNQTQVQRGDLLFINGETNEAEVYLVSRQSGQVADTLSSLFGSDHVVGGSYHEGRNTLFMVQDNVPSAALSNLIAEIDPVTGDTLNIFQISDHFDVFFGDVDAGCNGNLFVVSSAEDSVAEYSPSGTFIMKHALPAGVTNLSGIDIDCTTGEAWVSSNSPGVVYHLGNFPGGITALSDVQPIVSLSIPSPNPFTDHLSFTVTAKQGEKLKVSVNDITGQEIRILFEGAANNDRISFNIDASFIQSGIYLLKSQSSSGTSTTKIISLN